MPTNTFFGPKIANAASDSPSLAKAHILSVQLPYEIR
jgi:hypothetical protein